MALIYKTMSAQTPSSMKIIKVARLHATTARRISKCQMANQEEYGFRSKRESSQTSTLRVRDVRVD